MNYYNMEKSEKAKIRQIICDRAYKEIPKPQNGELLTINLGYGVPMGILNSIKDNKRDDILLQGESCIIGMGPLLEKGDERIDMHRVTPAGDPILIDEKKGCLNKNVSDSFAFINSGKIYAAFLGAFQVSKTGDIANWATSNSHKPGPGGAMALCKGAQRVIVCMIEEGFDGESKLVDECSLPLTGKECVKLVITDKGVYKPNGKEFQKIEIFDKRKNKYVKCEEY